MGNGRYLDIFLLISIMLCSCKSDMRGNIGLAQEGSSQTLIADSLSRDTLCDQAVSITLSGQDVVEGPNPLRFAIVEPPAQGSILDFDELAGTLVYRPDLGFVGTDGFFYAISDGENSSESALVSIRVLEPGETNIAPSADSFTRSTTENQSYSITLLGSDEDDDPLEYSISSQPTHGVISNFNSHAGTLVYTPDGGFSGTDQFMYQAHDGQAYSNIGTVTMVVSESTGSILTNLFFLHHSTGTNLVSQGSVRAHIATYNASHGTSFEFWDHGYVYQGLFGPDGQSMGYDYGWDNTDPIGLHGLWTTDNASRTMIMNNHEVIAFKSCYPASAITTDEMLEQYKTWYREMRSYFDQHPEKIFVVMSPPPLHRLTPTQSPDRAARARAFATWLGSAEYLSGHSNIVYFNFFDLLAEPDSESETANMLRYEYERSHTSTDSHPNTLANQTIGPIFAQMMIDAGLNH